MQDSDNKTEQPFLKTGFPPETGSELNSGTSSQPTPNVDEIGVEMANLERKIDGLAANADGQTADGQTAKKRVGAPFGNQNGFKNGSTWLDQAKRGLRPAPDSATEARKFAKELIRDLGGKHAISRQELEIIEILRDDKEIYEDLKASRADIYEAKPEAKQNIGAIEKINSKIKPVKNDIVNNLERLGLKRRAYTIDIPPWEREQVTDAIVSKGNGKSHE